MREELLPVILERPPRRVHLSLLDALALRLGQPLAAEVDDDAVDAGVGRAAALGHLVGRDVRLASVHLAQGQAALLQFGLGVVPLLVQDELAQTREEAHLGERLAEGEVLVDVEGADVGLQQVGSVLDLEFAPRVGGGGKVGDAEVVGHHGLGAVVDDGGS